MKHKRAVMTALITLVGGWLVLCVLVYVMQASLVYHPSSAVDRTPADVGLSFEDVTLTTADGEQLGAWFVPAKEPRGTVLFCHGNAGNISGRLRTLEILTRVHMNVLMFDYRGFGTSTGTPHEDGLYADVLAAWEHLVGRGEDPARTIIMGRSLGGGPAVWLAARVQAAGLVVESSFTSAVDLGREVYPFLPVGLLSRHRFESSDRIGGIGEPVLVAHSPGDTLIPPHHGDGLFAAASEPKTFLKLAGDHNDSVDTTGPAYGAGLDAFFTTVLPAR